MGQEESDSGMLPVKKSKGPVVITADDLNIDNEQKIATYTGNVKVIQGETSMFSDKLVIYLDETGKQLQKAVATDNLRLVNDDITATGEMGTFYNAEQKLELENNAKVWQGNNTITAHRIIAYLDAEIIEGYANPETERAVMTVYTKDTTPTDDPDAEAASEPTPEPEAESAQSSTPIVIEADQLKLDNPAQVATYSGNVIATQELTKMYADEMVVSITKNEAGEDDIDRINVAGNVRIVQEETVVTGEKGFFLNQDQYAEVQGTPKQKARAEDKAQNMVLEAPIIEAYLDTNTIKARGATTVLESPQQEQRVHTVIGGDESETGSEEDEDTEPGEDEAQEPQNQNEELPSLTLYPNDSQEQ